MFVIFLPRRSTFGVRLKEVGTFFCLNCEKTRHFERREWRIGGKHEEFLVFLPQDKGWQEFVLCTSCELPFKPECLDEASKAYLEELILTDVPDRAISTKLRSVYFSEPGPRYEPSAEYYGEGEGAPASSWLTPEEELRAVPRQNGLIAYSTGRRH